MFLCQRWMAAALSKPVCCSCCKGMVAATLSKLVDIELHIFKSIVLQLQSNFGVLQLCQVRCAATSVKVSDSRNV
ncbi:hypothetical protein RchiOBHm_Chr7g0182801 [Rosa chinensis]|uniref:Secreted protein n=1 Tax=Rosa chinensis TaxID=74649 RepID=A0A2P6P2Y5_ROSCH|nr:hypothetical protein RchiOBHm_Chr7g0182801 [Rosa chinensis]